MCLDEGIEETADEDKDGERHEVPETRGDGRGDIVRVDLTGLAIDYDDAHERAEHEGGKRGR